MTFSRLYGIIYEIGPVLLKVQLHGKKDHCRKRIFGRIIT
jgi:hypothetical protein